MKMRDCPSECRTVDTYDNCISKNCSSKSCPVQNRWNTLGITTVNTYGSRKKTGVWRWKNSKLSMSVQSTTVDGTAANQKKIQANYIVTHTHYGTKFIMHKYTVISELSWSKPITKWIFSIVSSMVDNISALYTRRRGQSMYS